VRTPDRECNERLEFLGDSVLGLAITDELYRRLPDQQEGELTRIKSAVVSRGALYRASTRMGLVRFIEVAKGVGRREELPVSLTANLVESIIGAIYLDAGFFPAREFILRHLGPELEDVLNDRVAKNYKSLLQHEAQERMGVTPVYRTIEEEGPDHRRNFVVAAVLRGTEYGRASGINKKDAEQEAARHALEALQRSGRGRRRRNDGRGDGRADGRGDGRPEARGGEARPAVAPADARSFDVRSPEPRSSDAGPRPDRPFGAEVERAGQDEAAWRSWAEKRGAPSAPSAPGVIGPEADDGWDEPARVPVRDGPERGPAMAQSPTGVPARSGPELARSSAAEPTGVPSSIDPAEPAASTSLASEGASPVGEADDAEGRGRRRRRGGRGRGRAALTDADTGLVPDGTEPATRSRGARRPASSETPAATPADALLSDVFAEPPPATSPVVAVPSPIDPSTTDDSASRGRAVKRPAARKPAAREVAPLDAGSAITAGSEPAVEERPRRATRAATARGPKSERAAPEAKPPASPAASPASKADVGFGAGVEPAPTTPTPAIERQVTVVGKVEAVKPVPKAPRPAPPSGFGDGL
jgi:ribonuclease-3